MVRSCRFSRPRLPIATPRNVPEMSLAVRCSLSLPRMDAPEWSTRLGKTPQGRKIPQLAHRVYIHRLRKCADYFSALWTCHLRAHRKGQTESEGFQPQCCSDVVQGILSSQPI